MEQLIIKTLTKSDTEIETYESIKELKFFQEYADGGIIIVDDLNETEMNDPKIRAMSKRSRPNNLSIFIISQDYYELPKRTIRVNENIYHIFKQFQRCSKSLPRQSIHGYAT